MKITGHNLKRALAPIDSSIVAYLVYGADPVRVATARREVVTAILGGQMEKAREELRLNSLGAAALRSDPVLLGNMLQERGFFPGPRLVLVEDATDILATVIEQRIKEWQDGDAYLVVTAAALRASSKLRKLFEQPSYACAIAIYEDPLDEGTILALLRQVGLAQPDRPVMAQLMALACAIDLADFRQFLEKLSLYKYKDTSPLQHADIAACRPATLDSSVDALIEALTEGQTSELIRIFQRLMGQSIAPVRICILVQNHFKTLYQASCDPRGIDMGLAALRPPVFGPRKDQLRRQLRRLPKYRIESAIMALLETDRQLRKTHNAPDFAVLERSLLRLSMQLGR